MAQLRAGTFNPPLKHGSIYLILGTKTKDTPKAEALDSNLTLTKDTLKAEALDSDLILFKSNF